MTRSVLSSDQVEPGALAFISGYHEQTLREVISAVSTNKVVIVGMKMNPFVKKARDVLQANGVEFKYLEYGSYFSGWKPRLAIKLWSGWPTYPQVFVNGKLIGGFQETNQFIQTGNLKP